MSKKKKKSNKIFCENDYNYNKQQKDKQSVKIAYKNHKMERSKKM